jgi:hypothetical protein
LGGGEEEALILNINPANISVTTKIPSKIKWYVP